MRMKQLAVIISCILLMASTAFADDMKPGKGVTLNPARATWNTGFFQEALVRRGLEELGYTVKKPKDLAVPLAYKSIEFGDVDYWANGWFPIHNAQLSKDFDKNAQAIGYIIKAGGIQGYLVSKREVEKYNIKSLDDFKRPEVIEAFDQNGDGKADLTACPPGWGCEKTIGYHMDVYGLNDYIKPIKASYEASVASALAAYKSGKPAFLYTWGPNWTLFKFKPGEDVLWMNVPELKPNEAQKGSEDRMVVRDVVGAVSNPVSLGFVVSDVRIVANNKFLEANPAAKKFFEIFALPLSDINEQNTRMNEGEKSPKHIKQHVDEWIAKNTEKWNGWLAAARAAAK